MSYSSFLKNFPDKLGQPTGIAVMASVVVHALIAITLPYWPVFSREQPKQLREVELVGLTPEMASRLPPPPQPKKPILLPPSQPPSTFPKQPAKDTDLGKLLTTPRQPVRRRYRTQVPQKQFNRQKKRIVTGPVFSNKTINIPELDGKKVKPRTYTPEELARLTTKPNISVQGSSNNTLFQPQRQSNNPLFQPQRQNNNPLFQPQEPNNNTFSPPQEPNNNTSSPPQEPNDNTSSPPQEPNNNTALVPQRQESPEQKIQRMRASITPNQKNTSPEEAEENSKKLQEEWNQDEPTISTIPGSYPTLACYKDLEGTSVVGVLVGGDGKATQQQLIQSAGYPIFDEQAQEDIQSRSFENQTGEPKLYHVNVNFKYNEDICPSLKVPQQPNQENSNSEETTTEQSTSENSNSEEATTEQSTSENSNSEEATTEQSTSENSDSQETTTEQSTSENSDSQETTTEQPTSENSDSQETTES